MSASAASHLEDTPVPPPNGHVVNLISPTVARAVVSELLLRPETLNTALRDALASANGDKAVMAAIERMPVWVDLSALVSQKMGADARQWRAEALSFCVLRGASFELLIRLFKVTRAEVAKVRADLGVPSETRPKAIPDTAVDSIFEAWQGIRRDAALTEAECWINLAQAFPGIGLNSLYQVIVKES